MATLLKEVLRKARKLHTCCECACKIERGQRYHFTTYAQDGEVYSSKLCSECEEMQNWLNANHQKYDIDLSEVYIGQMWEVISEIAWDKKGLEDLLFSAQLSDAAEIKVRAKVYVRD
jgi:hypothetical protein